MDTSRCWTSAGAELGQGPHGASMAIVSLLKQPKWLHAGTFYPFMGGKPAFYFVRHPSHTLAIDIEDGGESSSVRWRRLVLEVAHDETPEAVAEQIEAAVRKAQPLAAGSVAGGIGGDGAETPVS